jgi:RNA polymerase sigma-70 factor, ECF subfamily
VLATLIRLLGDFDRAEEAMHDAFTAALDAWPREGVPQNPRAWLVSTGRFKAIDKLRRNARFDAALSEVAEQLEAAAAAASAVRGEGAPGEEAEGEGVDDDRLRLIFTCCHPALSADARIALTLREVCGLETEQIARAFLTSAPTLAQRIVRAKGKILDARIPYQVPALAELPDRLDAVLHVIYLVFNEGYSASGGDALTRPDLSGEAIRLGRLLVDLLPEPEAIGLLALMLLHDARREARLNSRGELVLLADQDRSLWNLARVDEGRRVLDRALRLRRPGPYQLQAAIASLHFEDETDWPQIAELYARLGEVAPSPVVELNRAVAVAMADGPERGLGLINSIEGLDAYRHLHSARADLLRRLGRDEDAADAYRRALELADEPAERVFLERRLAEVTLDA